MKISKEAKTTLVATIVKALVIISFFIISSYEIETKGTITGLSLLPLLGLLLWYAFVLVKSDAKELKRLEEGAPDEEEAEDDEW